MDYSKVELIAFELSFINSALDAGKIPKDKLKEFCELVKQIELAWKQNDDISTDQVFNAMFNKYGIEQTCI